MWQVTCDRWHVTGDRWHMTHGVGWTFSYNFSSLALTVWDLWFFEDLEEKDQWVSDSVNKEAVRRTAPATRGLLKTLLPLSYSTISYLYFCHVYYRNLFNPPLFLLYVLFPPSFDFFLCPGVVFGKIQFFGVYTLLCKTIYHNLIVMSRGRL